MIVFSHELYKKNLISIFASRLFQSVVAYKTATQLELIKMHQLQLNHYNLTIFKSRYSDKFALSAFGRERVYAYYRLHFAKTSKKNNIFLEKRCYFNDCACVITTTWLTSNVSKTSEKVERNRGTIDTFHTKAQFSEMNKIHTMTNRHNCIAIMIINIVC